MPELASEVYIIAARRTAIGRVGGLHRARRVEDLAAHALLAALGDSRLDAADIDEIIVGNASEGGNPARLIGLSAGLPDTVPALTLDRQCASGLEAILAAGRLISGGEAEIVAAGGAESLSTAPWRLMKPRAAHHLPRFLDHAHDGTGGPPAEIEASEALASGNQITRLRQDEYAVSARRAGAAARLAGTVAREIAAMKAAAVEGRDELASEPSDLDHLAELAPIDAEGGTLTTGNTSQFADAAAMVIAVSEAVYQRLGRPPALRLMGSASVASPAGSMAAAPIEAVLKLRGRLNGSAIWAEVAHELNETSAAQAIAYRDRLGIAPHLLNRTGGALTYGRPFGASSAVLVVRLFAQLLTSKSDALPVFGLAATGAVGGLATAALFEAVPG